MKACSSLSYRIHAVDTLLAVALKYQRSKSEYLIADEDLVIDRVEEKIMELRPAIFAGSWYPQKPGACEGEIQQFLAGSVPRPQTRRTWMGGIVPHAGWYYSGQIACNVIQWLKDETALDLVVLFGMHLHSGSSNYLMEGPGRLPWGLCR